MLPCQNSKTFGMIRMLVRDYHCTQITPFQTDLIQSLLNSFIADSGINQNMCMIRTDIHTISAAAAGNTY